MSEPPASTAVVFRPAVDDDRATLDAFVEQVWDATAYAETFAYAVRSAFDERMTDTRAVVAECDGATVGFAIVGEVGGTRGTARIQFIGVIPGARLRAIGVGLCEAAMASLAARGARVVVAELPDDPLLSGGRAFLARCGFVETARVADYYRDGIALIVLQRSTGA